MKEEWQVTNAERLARVPWLLSQLSLESLPPYLLTITHLSCFSASLSLGMAMGLIPFWRSDVIYKSYILKISLTEYKRVKESVKYIVKFHSQEPN